MADATALAGPRRPLWQRVLLVVAVVLLALVLLVVFFPWDLLRGPVNRYVSERTGRHFEITRKLDVKLGRTTRVFADGIVFANPGWAQDPYLVKAEAAMVEVRLWPLLRGRIELPLVELRKPELGLQAEADGRRTWALGRDTGEKKNLPEIGALAVDEGTVHYVAPHQGADIRGDFAIDAGSAPARAPGEALPAQALPLRFKARGTWQKQPFAADGRTGSVLSLGSPLAKPFPARLNVSSGSTRLQAEGSLASVRSLAGADVAFQLQGSNLADLYQVVGVVLPETPRYAVRGRLTLEGAVWRVAGIDGKLGNSDIAGALALDRSGRVPFLRGDLHSKALDFNDLAPLVGLRDPPGGKSPATRGTPAAAKAEAGKRLRAARREAGRVLPATALDVERLKAMNADVRYAADRVTNAPKLPLERMSTHVQLKDSVLLMDPLDLGVAGGRLAGRMRIDGQTAPVAVELKLQARALELSRLFPSVALTRGSFGKINGEIDLAGRGKTVADMLGSSSGNVALLMGQGQISNLLLEFAGLDGGEIIKFLMGKDRSIGLRCAATAFEVKRGLMTSRALVLDTTDTVIYGGGTINLANEALDMTLRPAPKDMSILSLRSPLHLTGTLGAPQGSIDKTALAGRAALAIALGAINPLLALAATVETGPGQDADCAGTLRAAATPQATAPQPPDAKPSQVLGGPAERSVTPAAPAAAPAPAAPRVPGRVSGRP